MRRRVKRSESRVSRPHGRRQSIARSFANAYSGISYSARTQRNVRIHLAAAAGVIAAGVILRVSPLELAVLVLCAVVVISVEMINTAVECAVDLVTVEHHPLAKLAKDVSAGAVLISSVGAVVAGGIIFFPRLWQLMFGALLPYLPEISPVGKLV